MSFLLDTNVLSEMRKPKPDAHVQRWLGSIAGQDIFLSVLVLGEIRQGLERLRRRDPRQADVLQSWLAQVRTDYGDHVLPVTVEVAEAWGRLNANDPVPVVDGLMAATAIVFRLTLVTRNVTHVSRTGARMLNPFQPL